MVRPNGNRATSYSRPQPGHGTPTRGILSGRPGVSGQGRSGASFALLRPPGRPRGAPGGDPLSSDEVQHLAELKVDTANLYREEMFTDLRVATLRRLVPVRLDGTDDPS